MSSCYDQSEASLIHDNPKVGVVSLFLLDTKGLIHWTVFAAYLECEARSGAF
jgi:hypothetical protein